MYKAHNFTENMTDNGKCHLNRIENFTFLSRYLYKFANKPIQKANFTKNCINIYHSL